MKYRIIVSILIILVCAFAVALKSGGDVAQPAAPNAAQPNFNL